MDFLKYRHQSKQFQFQIFNIIAAFWLLRFITSMTEMILIGAFTTWFWTSNVSFFALLSSARRIFRYHVGTAALGSPIIYICSCVCSLLGIGIVRSGCGLCMCFRCCCLGCSQAFLRRFNRNAYIMCAIHGKPFCASAMDAYQLVFRNCSHYYPNSFVSGLIFFLSKTCLACATGAFVSFCYSFHSIIMQWLSLIFGAFYIFRQFFAVYAIAIDTLLLCARKYQCHFSSCNFHLLA